MAYMNQERKKALSTGIKSVFKKYGVKGTIAVRNHMVLVANIKSGPIDFIGNYNKTVDSKYHAASGNIDVNPYWFQDHFSGRAKDFLKELFSAMNEGNHNNSDIQTDYFDVGWYVDVNIGNWNKPYTLEA